MTDELENEFEEPEPLTDDDILRCKPLNTDSANADIFEERYGTSARFVTEWEDWIAWDGRRWAFAGARHKALAWALYSARVTYTETWGRIQFFKKALDAKLAQRGGKCDETDELKDKIDHLTKIAGWYLQSQNVSRANSCVTASATRLPTAMAELNAHPMLFNVGNGTIDLRTGDLLPHDREHRITQLSPVEWDDHAKCPTWDRFIDETTEGSAELAMYMQRVAGYCLTGSIKEHALFFLHGDGGNGKSTFAGALQAMMGEYAAPAPRGILFESKTGAVHPAELAMLYGLRFAVCAEVGEGHAFDEAKVKDLTGGDPLAVRRMNENFWTLRPMHKLLMFGQYKPIVRGDDNGIWRRFRLVPWKFTAKQRDLDLGTKLLRELPGILRWAVNGAVEWARIGLAEPGVVLEATQEYRDDSNVIAEFLKSCRVHPDLQCTSGDLRRHYERWCKDEGHFPLGGRALGARLRREGLTLTRIRLGEDVHRGWKGLDVPPPRDNRQ